MELISDGANLREAKLKGANLFGVHFRHAQLRVADLTEAILVKADLRGADLLRANLRNANLTEADLREATLTEANLIRADLNRAYIDRKTNFRGANLSEANLRGVNLNRVTLSDATLIRTDLDGTSLREAYLFQADLRGAHLSRADLSGANLSQTSLFNADLSKATLVRTNLSKANLTGCHVYGIAAWDINLEQAIQANLVITDQDQASITVDNLKIAQFIYLLLNNKEIRDVIDTITSKVVLILGRFTDERKIILDALRDELRKQNYSPVLFDFDKPTNRDITETISTLAHMARFVIADITEAKSIPQELSHIVPFLPSVPIVPLLQASEPEYGMYEHFPRYPWVLPLYRYVDVDDAIQSIQENIISPAEQKAKELNQS